MEDSIAAEHCRTKEVLTAHETAGFTEETSLDDHRAGRLFTQYSLYELFILYSQQKKPLPGVTHAQF